jgi:SAM-dependent methyltransferase
MKTYIKNKLKTLIRKLKNNKSCVTHGRALSLPDNVSENELFEFVTSVRVSDAPEVEMRNYGTHDFRRFVFTYGLVRNMTGKCLELGANPYFTTMLLKKFTQLELYLANYFGDSVEKDVIQLVNYRDIKSGQALTEEFKFKHFNTEMEIFPYEANSFDVVIFAEIIEHLTNDPCKVLREIKRVLKPNGTLILTTPNVARLENVAKMLAGVNIYDPYSGYGAYGRHNREYNSHELVALLTFEGFLVNDHFTADVHPDSTLNYYTAEYLERLVGFRKDGLGQYIFISAVKKPGIEKVQYPSWLYRSYPTNQLEEISL